MDVPNELWSALGALLIATAILATHPIKPAVADRIETQIATNWGQLAATNSTCSVDVPCFPLQMQ
jgi:hypothetical protein